MAIIILLLTVFAVRMTHLAHENRVAMAAEASGDNSLLLDSDLLRHVQLPFFRGVDRCKYHSDCFYLDDKGRLAYTSNKCTAVLGMDVSTYQQDVDWARVHADGINFVMLRVGFRGYGEEGTLNQDDRFNEYVVGAVNADLHVGVYFFSQATTPEEAEEEAAFVLSCIDGLPIDYPVVFDWESIHHDEARTDDLSAETITACANAFCRVIQDAGYHPMVYFSTYQGMLVYDLRTLRHYDFWLAQYTDEPYFSYDYAMLQFTETGTVDGVDGLVDLDLCFREY